jgi:succinyl-diaminopimelate desuccinylase
VDPKLTAALSAEIDASFDDEVAFLQALVRVPSDNPPGNCTPHSVRAADLLEEIGFTVERHPVPTDLCHANGMISATNLIIRQRFGAGPVIAFNAHGDVVAPGDGWSSDPYGAEIRDGWMYGRGAAVSKSDFATYVYALKAVMACNPPLAGSIEVHLTYDEEVGGFIGPKWLLDEGLSKPDYAVSAGFSYAVITAHNGCLHLEVSVLGKSAHAAKPSTGHDAMEAANAVLTALYQHRKSLGATVSVISGIGSPNLNVGLIEGGINTNVVPDRVTLRLDRRMIPEENAAEVEAGLRALIADSLQGLPGITHSVSRVLLAEPLAPVGDITHLAETLQANATRVIGEPVPLLGVPLYTDARHYATQGIPKVLYGAGPRSIEEANAHRADERLPLDSLRKATEVIAGTMVDMLAQK